MTETIDPLGNRTTYLYDAYGRQTEVIDPYGNRTTSIYDSKGRGAAVIDQTFPLIAPCSGG